MDSGAWRRRFDAEIIELESLEFLPAPAGMQTPNHIAASAGKPPRPFWRRLSYANERCNSAVMLKERR